MAEQYLINEHFDKGVLQALENKPMDDTYILGRWTESIMNAYWRGYEAGRRRIEDNRVVDIDNMRRMRYTSDISTSRAVERNQPIARDVDSSGRYIGGTL